MFRLVRCFLCESGRQNDEARPFVRAGLHNEKDDASLQPTTLLALACTPVSKMSLMLSMLLSVRRADASRAAAKPQMTPSKELRDLSTMPPAARRTSKAGRRYVAAKPPETAAHDDTRHCETATRTARTLGSEMIA